MRRRARAVGSGARRSPRLAIYALVVLTDGLHVAIVPLLPRFVERFALDGFGAGLLVAGPGVAMALVSLPSGGMADRLGPRHVALASALAVVVTAVAQPFAPSFATLLAARLLLGVAMGFAWVAGAAWLVRVIPPARSAGALGGIVIAAGAGIAVGPFVAGLTGQWLGLAAPFLLGAAAAVVVAALLATADPGAEPDRADDAAEGGRLSSTLVDPGIAIVSLGLVMSGFSSSALSVVIPLDLHADGISEAGIGLVFALATAAFMVSSTVTARRGGRLVAVAALVWCSLGQVVALTPAVVWGGVIAVVSMHVVSGAFRGVVGAVSLPLGSESAQRAAIGTGAAMGVLNAAWAASTVLGPVVAGLLLDALRGRAVFLVLQLTMLGFLGAVLLLARMLRVRERVAARC